MSHPRAGYGVDGSSRTVESSWTDFTKGESPLITERARKTIRARKLSGSLEGGGEREVEGVAKYRIQHS